MMCNDQSMRTNETQTAAGAVRVVSNVIGLCHIVTSALFADSLALGSLSFI